MASTSLSQPLRAAISSSRHSIAPIRPSNHALQYLRALNASSSLTTFTSVRYASHQAQGRANGVKNGPGKRLGAKKTGEQFVVPGNIIFRQRGTLWFPGENCDMGRDHTIFATEKGYVKYYSDPVKHPKRRYIGVVFERNMTLPMPPNAPRRRRLNMLAVPMPRPIETTAESSTPGAVPDGEVDAGSGHGPGSSLTVNTSEKSVTLGEKPKKTRRGVEMKMRSDYSFREANWEIGRTAERAGVKVREFKRGDRWLAWRKTTIRKAKNAEKKGMMKGKGGGKKGKGKK